MSTVIDWENLLKDTKKAVHQAIFSTKFITAKFACQTFLPDTVSDKNFKSQLDQDLGPKRYILAAVPYHKLQLQEAYTSDSPTEESESSAKSSWEVALLQGREKEKVAPSRWRKKCWMHAPLVQTCKTKPISPQCVIIANFMKYDMISERLFIYLQRK